MEVNLNPATAGTAAASAGPSQGQSTGKKDGQFGSLLQAAGGESTDDGKKEATDPLLALMAALSGGLSPLMLLNQQLQQQAAAGGAQGEAGLLLPVTFAGNSYQLDLSKLALNNGDFAKLVQDFGASPALMGVLLEQPLGQPAQTMAGHPELLADLGKAMNQMLQKAETQPQLVSAQPQIAQVLESILSQATANGGQEQSGEGAKGSNGFGKMLASISTHSLQIGSGEGTHEDHADQTNPLLANGLLVGTPLHLQQTNNRAQAQPVVHVHADQFHNEFAGMLVKRAALIETPGSQEFRILLQPHGLGEIEVRVQATGNQISLHFNADTAAAKGLLDAELGSLKSQLQAQGIQFNRIEITNGNANADLTYGGMPQERGSSQQYQQQEDKRSNDGDHDPFSIEALSELPAEEEILPEEDGIDVSA